jgi:hypothetical protein
MIFETESTEPQPERQALAPDTRSHTAVEG